MRCRDFLKRCEEYELHETVQERGVVPAEVGEYAGLTRMVTQRNAKLEKYRQKKELDDQIKQLKLVMQREHTDEDLKRDFYIKLLKSSILETQEELSSIEQEKQILEFQKTRQQDDPDFNKKPKRPPTQPLKPIIITKDEAQKAVYGLGYPSFPTMTVSEFYDERVREGIFPDPKAPKNTNSLQARAMRGDTADLDEQQDIEKEEKAEVDDEEQLMRQRAMDDWKDDHRRGEGNRHNRS